MVGKHMYVPAPSVREVGESAEPAIPERLDRLIEAMLEKDVADRPEAALVHGELEALQAGENLRQRGRPERLLRERSERAVDEETEEFAEGAAAEIDAEGAAVVGVVGEVRDDWRLSLGNAGFECREVDGPSELAEVDVLFIHEADVDTVERYAKTEGPPILAGCDTSNFEASTALLDTAAADVLPRPVHPSGLVDKVAGLWRKITRRTR
jgi:hypothetical protein